MTAIRPRIPSKPSLSSPRRRRVAAGLGLVAALGAGLGMGGAAQAQPASKEPLRVVVAWPAGGPTDSVARIVAAKLGEVLGRRTVVENKPGAAGMIGTESVVRGAPDGNTVLMAVFQDVTRTALGMKQSFDVLKELEPLGKVYDLPFLIAVNPAVLPVSGLGELIEHAKKQPLSYATPSNGSMGHLSFELIAQRAGIKPEHVAYRGSAPAVTDVLGGQVPMIYGDMVSLLPHIRAGKLRAIAVGSAARTAALPNLPTVAESGFPGFVGVAWGGLVVPAAAPAAAKTALADGLRKVMAMPEVLARIRDAGVEPAAVAPAADFGRFMKAEGAKWAQIIKDRGITAD